MTTDGADGHHDYRETSIEFLARARTYLAEDDLLQASEKGWGAAAQMVKAVADARGWRHTTHRDLYTTVNRLVDETGDGAIRTAFSLANELHQNFYEGRLPPATVEADLVGVTELVEKLDRLNGAN